MRFSAVLSGSALISVAYSYAHYANPNFESNLRHTVERRKKEKAPEPVGTLIGDLLTDGITSTVGADIASVLQGTGDGESFAPGFFPPDIAACLTSTDVCCAWGFISKELTSMFTGDDGQCNDLARAAIRLGFHDAGTWSQALAANGQDFGGADGSLVLFGEIARAENGGLEEIVVEAARMHLDYSPYNVGMADLIQFMANHATVTCPLGPRVKTFVGRHDATQAAPDGLLPSVHAPADSLVNLFLDKTITPEELVALLGAHSTSKQFGQDAATAGAPQDTTPGVWDVAFYGETLQPSAPVGVFRFDSDAAIAVSPLTSEAWQEFVDNQEDWNEAYARAYVRLSLLGVNNINSLADCTRALPPKLNSIPPPPPPRISSSTSSAMSSTSSAATSSSSSDMMTSSDSSVAPSSTSDVMSSSTDSAIVATSTSDMASYTSSDMASSTSSDMASSTSSDMASSTSSDMASSTSSDMASSTSSDMASSTSSYSSTDSAMADPTSMTESSTSSYATTSSDSSMPADPTLTSASDYSSYSTISDASSSSSYTDSSFSSHATTSSDSSMPADPTMTSASDSSSSYSTISDASASSYTDSSSSSYATTASDSSMPADPTLTSASDSSSYSTISDASTSSTYTDSYSSTSSATATDSSAVHDPSLISSTDSSYPSSTTDSYSFTYSSTVSSTSEVYDPSHTSSATSSSYDSHSSYGSSTSSSASTSSSYVYHPYYTSSSSTSSKSSYSVWDPSYVYDPATTSSASSKNMVYDPPVTVITTTYVDICPTGYTTIKTTYTAPAWSGMAKPAVPYGWTTTIAVCNNCAAYPTTVTLTKPVETYPGGPVTTATIYATRVLTVTVHNSASYSTEVYPVYTTTYPIGKPVPAGPDSNVPSAPVKPAYVSSVPGKAAVVSSVPYGSLPAVSVVNGGAAPGYPSPSFASSVNVKPVVTAGHGAAGTGTPANAAPYAKFTGAGVKESVSVVALFSALLFAIIL